MRKWILLILMVLITTNLVQAVICEEQIENGTSCLMVTPSITCDTYTYDIINVNTTEVIKDDFPLAPMNDTTYYFNFSEDVGDYQVILCDYTARQFRVVEPEGDKMVLAVMILLPMVVGLFMLIGAITLNDEEHHGLRIGLFLASLFSFFGSSYLGVQTIIKYYNFPEMQNAFTWVMYGIGGLIFFVTSYFLIYVIIVAVNSAAQKRKERLKY